MTIVEFSAFDEKLLITLVTIGDIGKPKWFSTIVVIGGIRYVIYCNIK